MNYTVPLTMDRPKYIDVFNNFVFYGMPGAIRVL